jgi:hypothetical protein
MKQLGMIATSNSWRRFWLNYRHLKYLFLRVWQG